MWCFFLFELNILQYKDYLFQQHLNYVLIIFFPDLNHIHSTAGCLNLSTKLIDMKKIIAPIDFSVTAENAAIFAGKLAAFYGAELWLYHTYLITIPVSSFGYPFITSAEMNNAAEHELEEYKARILDAVKSNITIHIKAENNTLSEGLMDLCKDIKPDLVVMGLSGKNALTRLVVGSNTIRAIQQLDYPILVIPPKAEFNPVRKMLFACDYEEMLDLTPIEPLIGMVKDFNADLVVLNLIFSNVGATNEKLEEGRYIVEYLKDLKPTYRTILTEDVVDGINEFAEKEKADWIAIIPRKHSLAEQLFKRSTTKDLIHHIQIPVLCIHG